MDKYLGILSSDALNRDGYVILFEVLENMIAKNALNGLPSLIGHNIHRPLGWIFPYGILIEPKISKTIGNFLICETNEDIELIYPKIDEFWKRSHYESIKNYKDKFIELLRENYKTEGNFIVKGCVAYHLPNIVEKIFPSLFENKDKDDLIYLNDLLNDFYYIGSGIFKSKNTEFSIYCHQYFNRNLSMLNNYNTYFIDEFIKLNSNNNITLRIAIDKNLIGFSETYRGVLEFDYWWGPKFNNDISRIPNEVTRYECNDKQKFFSGVLGTEFWWKTDKNERTLEIEEIREQPSLGIDEDSYGCRYIHSIYDSNKNEFVHFDGAIRLYLDEQILQRWEVNINKAGKDTTYTKLFRIDGKLELSDWKKLCILYYKGNPLLFEYFEAKEEYDSIVNETQTKNSRTNYTPYKINSDDGVRLFVSYHKKNLNYKQFERKIINPDIIEFQSGEKINVIEYDIIEIEKYLKRNDGQIEYPNNINFVKPYDFATNYPIIIHGSNKTDKLIVETLTAFRTIFQIQNSSLNKTIALTIGWEMEDFEVRLSVFGKSSEIVKWFNSVDKVPVEYEKFRIWLSNQRQWIYDNYKYSERDFSHLLKDDGIFYIKRETINYDYISFPHDKDRFYYEVNTNGNKELNNLIEEKAIFPSYSGLLKKVSCTKTGEDYFTSMTSKYLDTDVKMAIEEIDLLGFFWTDEEY